MATTWWNRLLKRTSRPAPRRRPPHRPTLEPLEARELLTAFPPPVNTPDRPLGMNAIAAPRTSPEPLVAVSPSDPNKLVVSTHNELRTSTNLGGSFQATPTTFPRTSLSDTAMAYDSQGRLFWTNIVFTSTGETLGITQVNPSTGALIPNTTFTIDNSGIDDKPFLSGDPTSDNLYAVWLKFPPGDDSQVMISRSTNQGRNWSSPLRVDNGTDGVNWAPTVTVANDGQVYVAYHSQNGFSGGGDGGGNPDGVSGKTVVVSYNNFLNPQSATRAIAIDAGLSDVTFNTQSATTGKIPGARF